MNQKISSKRSEKRLTISLSKEHYELLERIAIKEDVSKAKIVRDAIKLYLNQDTPLFQNS